MATDVKFRLAVDGGPLVSQTIDGVTKKLEAMGGTAGLAKNMLGAMAAALSVREFTAYARAAIDAADAMNDLSQRVGISVQALAKYELAAAQSGTSLEALAKGIKGIAVNLSEHGDALRKAGISATTADGAMQQLADVFKNMPDGMEKTTLAVKLFGKSGMDLIPMLNLGSAGLQEAAEKSADYAKQMAILAPLADAFNDNLATMAMGGKTLGLTLINQVMPSLTHIAEALAVSDGTAAGFAKTVGSVLNVTLQTAALLASDVAFVLRGMGREIGGIIAQFSALGEGGGIFSAEGRAAWTAVGDAMKEDAQRAREELDRWQDQLVAGISNVQSAYSKRQGFGEKEYTDGAAQAKALLAALKDTNSAQSDAAKLAKEREAAEKKALEEVTKTAQARANARNKEAEDIDAYMRAESTRLADTARASEDAVRAAQDEYDNHGKLKSEIAQTTLARLQDQLVSKTAGTEAYESLARQISAQKQLIDIMQKGEVRDAAEQGAKDLAAANKKAAEESSKYWEDALMRAFESGKGFFQSLWDTIKNTLKTQVLKVLVQGVIGGIGFGAAGAASANGGSGSLTGGLGALSNIYDLATTGIRESIANGFAKVAGSSFGQSIGLSNSTAIAGNNPSAYAPPGTQLTGVGSQIGSVVQGIGSAGVAYGLQKTLSGGYKTGESGLVDAATAIAGFFDPTGGLLAGAIGAIVNRAFGRKLADQGLQGNFGGEAGFTGNNFQFYEGGWFRSDKTTTSALDTEVQSGMATQFKTMQTGMVVMADALGLGADAVKNFTSTIKLSFNGLTEAQITEKLNAEFATMSDTMAASVLGTTQYIRTGETATQTLSRLSGSLLTVNGMFGAMGVKLMDVGLIGANAASTLVDAFGGAEAFMQSMSGYYANFYSEAQQTDNLARVTSDSLSKLGLSMPTEGLREWYRAQVDAALALDQSIPANAAYTASLIKVQSSVNTLATSAETAAQKIIDAAAKLQADIISAQDSAMQSYMSAQADYNSIIAQEQEAAAQAMQQAADASAQAAEAIRSAMASAGQGIAALIRDLTTTAGGTLDPMALMRSTQRAYLDDLRQAQAGDVEASGRVAASARAYLDANNAVSGGNRQAATVAQVVRELGALPAVKTYEQQLLDAVKGVSTTVSTSGTTNTADLKAALASKLTAQLTVDATSTILKLINFVANTDLLPDDLKAIAIADVSSMSKTVNFIAGSALSEPLKQLALATSSATVRTYDFVARSQLTPEQMQQAFGVLVSGDRSINIVTGSMLSDDAKMQAFGAIQSATRLVYVVAESTALDAYKKTALEVAASATKWVNLAATGFSSADASLISAASSSVTKQVALALGSNDPIALSVVAAQSSTITKIINASGGALTLDQQVLLNAVDTYNKTVNIDVKLDATELTAFQTLLKSIFGTISIPEIVSTGGAGDLSGIVSEAYLDRLSSINTYINSLDWSLENTKASAWATYYAAKQYGVSQADIANATGYAYADVQALFDNANVPRFALGGLHAGGVRLVGENGPELEVTGPSRIYNAADTMAILRNPQANNEALVQEIRSLRQTNERLEARLAAIERNTQAGAVHGANSADSLRTIVKDGLEAFTDPNAPPVVRIVTDAASPPVVSVAP